MIGSIKNAHKHAPGVVVDAGDTLDALAGVAPGSGAAFGFASLVGDGPLNFAAPGKPAGKHEASLWSAPAVHETGRKAVSKALGDQQELTSDSIPVEANQHQSAMATALGGPHHETASTTSSQSAKQRFIEAISTLRYSHSVSNEPRWMQYADRHTPALFASIASPH